MLQDMHICYKSMTATQPLFLELITLFRISYTSLSKSDTDQMKLNSARSHVFFLS